LEPSARLDRLREEAHQPGRGLVILGKPKMPARESAAPRELRGEFFHDPDPLTGRIIGALSRQKKGAFCQGSGHSKRVD